MSAAIQDDRYYGPATLVLSDGRVFRGRAFGAKTTVVGELVFNTSMFGYQEIVSDPSYTDQLVCLTASEIGNVGTNADDDESSRGGASALLVRSLSPVTSNWRSESTLSDYLIARSIPGMAEFDTRALTIHLRQHGAQMGALSTEHDDVDALLELARKAPPMEGRDLVARVTTPEPYEWDEPTWGNDHAPAVKLHVVAYDFGIKRNILRMMRDQGIRVTVVPALTPAKDVLAMKPDGVFLSNGPGDPAAVEGAIAEIRELLTKSKQTAIFGICLGHQLLCLALGGTTYKLKFGHHGGNHPVRDDRNGRVSITSQNHGFAVAMESLGGDAVMTHRNLFDDTVAGFALRDAPVFGVQYHPEASPGPHDASPHFVEFVEKLQRARA